MRTSNREIRSAKMSSPLTLISLVIVVAMVVTQRSADANTVNLTAGLAAMRAEWFNPKYKSQSLDPYERYYFEQVPSYGCSNCPSIVALCYVS